MTVPTPTLAPLPDLPAGLRSRFVPGINGLTMHLLEAGFETPDRPCVLLLHGFPELGYSWRKLMPALAAAGYHVVAPDQRGYGRTTGWDAGYGADLAPFRMLNLVRDALALVAALGHRSVAAVVGHDFGSPVAAWCAVVRPDVFRAVVLMSAPFGGPPAWPFEPAAGAAASGLAPPGARLHDELAALTPPRKHYQQYYSTPEANPDMWHCQQGVHDFLRAYYHHKSADWPANQPVALRSWRAADLTALPSYYLMALASGMAETVAAVMPTAAQIAACGWLTDSELRVYSAEYQRVGFQGGLHWYRCATSEQHTAELQLFAGRRIDVPALFIAGQSDWGVHQKPGEFARLQTSACSQLRGCHLVAGAGHWVQQEQAPVVAGLLREFLGTLATAPR